MEGQEYTHAPEYGQEYPSSTTSNAGYYPQSQPPRQQYYAASSSSTTSTGSPTAYQPIYPAVGTYPSSTSGYASQAGTGGYDYSTTQPGGYPHTSASANDTLNENEAELKRLRNTAASARFRAKKKKREQSLERQSREKREELQRLENRISELEQENKFLKSLILTPKASVNEDEEGSGKGKEKSHGNGERRGGKGKDGVGTSRY